MKKKKKKKLILSPKVCLIAYCFGIVHNIRRSIEIHFVKKTKPPDENKASHHGGIISVGNITLSV